MYAKDEPAGPICLPCFDGRQDYTSRMNKALEVAQNYGGIDGAHHKTWVIDQMVRALCGNSYAEFVAAVCAGEDGPQTYEWDEGIAP